MAIINGGNIKGKKITILIVILVAIVGIVSCFAFIPPSATTVYNDNLSSIVELKAMSEGVGESFGTAEIVKKDGTVVTNAHVITYKRLGETFEFDKYYIRFANEDNYRETTLVKYDLKMDIAVLRINNIEGLQILPISIADSDNLDFGDKVYAMGNGVNYGISITQGIVSIPKLYVDYDNESREVIQSDVTIAEGNSGGALLDKKGRMIGMTTFRIRDISGDVIYGLAYSIPINLIIEYLNE